MLNPRLKPVVQQDARVNALLKEQMAEHEAIIASHHREMQELRDALCASTEHSKSILEQVVTQNKQQALDHGTAISALQDKIKGLHAVLADHKRAIDVLTDDLQYVQTRCAYRIEGQNFFNSITRSVEEARKEHVREFQNWQQSINQRLLSLKDCLEAIKKSGQERVAATDQKIESGLTSTRIDKEGVSREIQAYKKSIFIIEKKIEHLYILIERLKQTGEACHKPE